ncbi:hypothetical protein PISMIDRAFT_421294 [Pisolithus microcarpus 441]|uniref:Unplaced genomic scaffold scaffold_36, whole genome shotgun sequence n=1 Tax=Pisolithus microcarpus 441 TaxID=765257 RepID=A0A0C9ZWM7_9AGAM|nr:hypothetical protein BKA83DRAFT_421294 [Pisolithus microcarpus]KIK24033.1 hypothetical protein PISMIDRAFT_421294 [Pisolithus microcarpus 441]
MVNLLSTRLTVSRRKSYHSPRKSRFWIGPENHHRFMAVFPLTSPPIKDHRHPYSTRPCYIVASWFSRSFPYTVKCRPSHSGSSAAKPRLILTK